MFSFDIHTKETSVTWSKKEPSVTYLGFHGFLQWWGGLFIIFMCSFSILNASLPTSVYLDDFCAIIASSRLGEPPEMAPMAAKKQDMQSMQVPHSTGFLKLYLAYLREQTLSLHWHTAKPLLSSLSASQTYNILSPPSSSSSASSSLIYILIHRQRDLLLWQHSHFFTLCTILLCLTFTEAQQVVRYSAEHFIYNTTELLSRFFFSL